MRYDERIGKVIRVDKNGTKYFVGIEACDRCGGAGQADKWYFTGKICYKCGGSGTQSAKWKEYTPEYEAKLEERRAKRRAKWLEEHKEELEAQERAREEKRQQEEAERKAREEAERLEQERIEAQKLKSRYVGEIGERITLEAVYEYTAWFTVKGFYGGEDTIYIHNFRAGDNKLIWKSSKGRPMNIEEGDKIRLVGTVKEHKEYKGEKQTSLTRCRMEYLDSEPLE